MRVVSGILLLAFLAVVGTFAYQNRGPVDICFVQWAARFPLAAVVVAGYVLGMFTGWSVLGFFRRSLRRVREPVE